jgi:hypothetical protein
MYSHPNPATKEFFVQRIGGDNRGYSQNMIIQLETSIVHVYYYLNILFEDIQILLGYFKPEYSKKRELSLDKLKEVFLNLNNGHFKPKKIDTVT